VLVWADGQAEQTTNGEWHASWRLDPVSGSVVLARHAGGGWQVLDALNYSRIEANQSYGSYPEGDAWSRGLFYTPTPGWENTPAAQAPAVRINEWMAKNSRTLANPATAAFDDWFELYNAGVQAAFLGGYYLSDTLTVSNQFRIPNGTTIAAGGHLLVWADNAAGTNAAGEALHASFALAQSGEALGLFTPQGVLVDGVAFGAQQTDISEGRWPDAGAEVYAMAIPTPGSSNVLFVISSAAVGTNAATIEWVSAPARVYALEQTTNLLGTNWAVAGVVTADASTTALSDTNLPGVPARFYRIKQLP
jgi:hypothetical protein